MKPKTVVIFIIIVLFLVILLQNVRVITLYILFWEISMSQIIFLPIIFIVGVLVGYLLRVIGKPKA